MGESEGRMTERRFLDVPGRAGAAVADDRDDLVVWCSGSVEQHTSAVLLLHDRLANARSWDLVMSRLPTGVAVVAVDLRGRGSAWRQRPSLGIDSHVADVNDLLDRLDIDEVLAVGHGFGAAVASALAVTLPDRVPLTVGVLGDKADDPFDSVLGLAFPDRDEHLRYWKLHHRFAAVDARVIDGFVAHGIAGPEDHHRWRVDLRSLVADDQACQAAPQLHLSRSIVMGSSAASPVPEGSSTQLLYADPAVALLTNSGADAIAAQVRVFLS